MTVGFFGLTTSGSRLPPPQATRSMVNVTTTKDLQRVNKLDTVNSLNRIKKDQDQKIEHEYGNDLLRGSFRFHSLLTEEEKATKELSEEERNKELYLRYKAGQIRSKRTDKHFVDHEINYCDSIMMIAELARCLPRPTEAPEVIWQKLMKPLHDCQNKNQH